MASRIIVEGFKSIGERVEVEIRPLTLLAGANSSGKSSLMQAILLLKQTLEVPFDPGPLFLNGPNVKFTAIDQILHTGSGKKRCNGFTVGFEDSHQNFFTTRIVRRGRSKTVFVEACWIRKNSGEIVRITPGKSEVGVPAHNDEHAVDVREKIAREYQKDPHADFVLFPDRFALRNVLIPHGKAEHREVIPLSSFDFGWLRDMIHVPGLRGNPERSYSLSATGPIFPGTFERYTASLIASWSGKQAAKLKRLNTSLQQMGLTWKVEANRLDDANVELRVGRLSRPFRGANGADLVNIADVGFGVSQTLPVVVALLEARPGQLVYIEQPEIHLHPKAQVAMAGLLADAAKRGVELVIETHSSLLLLAVQTLVAEGDLSPDLVKLHWFSREEKTGATKITSADLDDAGRFGDWPEDFDDVALSAQSQYLDAVEAAVAKE